MLENLNYEMYAEDVTKDLFREQKSNHRNAVVQDLATRWIQSFQCKTGTSQEMEKSLRKFLESTEKPKVIYTYTSLEF